MDSHLDPSREKEQTKEPHVILLDDQQSERNYQEGKDFFDSFHRFEKATYPMPFRFFTFTASLTLFLSSAILACFLIISLFIGLLALYQSPTLNGPIHRIWKILRRLLVISLGLFIGSFSPAFGFGIVLLYFIMQGEKLNVSILSRMMNK